MQARPTPRMSFNLASAMIAMSTIFAMLPASAQSLQQATPAPSNGIGTLMQAARPTPPATIPSQLGQRPAASTPISATGPSVVVPQKIVAPSPDPAKRLPGRVFDANGRPVQGAVQVSPTRAYDPATGRYFQTPPASP